MAGLSAHDVIRLWESADRLTHVDRALAILARAGDAGVDHAAIPIGRRDADLFEIRAATFGATMPCRVSCPACATEIEASFAPMIAGPGATSSLSVEADGWTIDARLPDSRDVARAAADPDVDLLDDCIVTARRDGVARATDDLPDAIRETVALAMSDADPMADVALALACPSCGHAWSPHFDIVTFLWEEIETCAVRLLREVHTLARTYGWSEDEILALPTSRRSAYMELIGS